MFRFCIVLLPRNNNALAHVIADTAGNMTAHVPTHQVINNAYPHLRDPDGAEYSGSPTAPYPIYFFQTMGARDTAVDILAKSFPGYSFAPLEIGSITQSVPGPIKQFTVSDRGLLPA